MNARTGYAMRATLGTSGRIAPASFRRLPTNPGWLEP